jgi:hypothetical protein
MKYNIAFVIAVFILLCPKSNAQESIRKDIESLREHILSNSKTESALINDADSRDLAVLGSYMKAFQSFDSREQEFLSTVLPVIKRFRGKALDTQAVAHGDIDGDGEKDLIESHIFETNGVIHVESCWRKNEKVLWSYNLENPYLWIGPSELFQYDTRDIWVVFTIAITSALPKLHSISDFKISKERIISDGIRGLVENGFKITREEYRKYLESFKGLILQYGEPELGGGFLYIWYEPAKRFIPYYSP